MRVYSLYLDIDVKSCAYTVQMFWIIYSNHKIDVVLF